MHRLHGTSVAGPQRMAWQPYMVPLRMHPSTRASNGPPGPAAPERQADNGPKAPAQPASRGLPSWAWALMSRLANAMMGSGSDAAAQPSLGAMLTVEFGQLTDGMLSQAANMPPSRREHWQAFCTAWGTLQEKHYISTLASLPAASTRGAVIDPMLGVLPDPQSLAVALQLGVTGRQGASFAQWLAGPIDRDSTEARHAFVMQQALQLILQPGTERRIAPYPPPPSAAWVQAVAQQLLAVHAAVSLLPADATMQGLVDAGSAFLRSAVYMPMKDLIPLAPQQSDTLLTAAWLYQLITATALLFMSNTLGNTPDKLIVCSAVLHDMLLSLKAVRGQLPLDEPMALYLASQVVAIGLDLHELGADSQELHVAAAHLASCLEEAASSSSGTAAHHLASSLIMFDACNRLGEYNLRVSKDYAGAARWLERALSAFQLREARTLDDFQELSDDLTMCAFYSFWRDAGDELANIPAARSLPGAVYLHRCRMRCILDLQLARIWQQQPPSDSLYSVAATKGSLRALTFLMSELASSAGGSTSQPGRSAPAPDAGEPQLAASYLRSSSAIEQAVEHWVSTGHCRLTPQQLADLTSPLVGPLGAVSRLVPAVHSSLPKAAAAQRKAATVTMTRACDVLSRELSTLNSSTKPLDVQFSQMVVAGAEAVAVWSKARPTGLTATRSWRDTLAISVWMMSGAHGAAVAAVPSTSSPHPPLLHPSVSSLVLQPGWLLLDTTLDAVPGGLPVDPLLAAALLAWRRGELPSDASTCICHEGASRPARFVVLVSQLHMLGAVQRGQLPHSHLVRVAEAPATGMVARHAIALAHKLGLQDAVTSGMASLIQLHHTASTPEDAQQWRTDVTGAVAALVSSTSSSQEVTDVRLACISMAMRAAQQLTITEEGVALQQEVVRVVLASQARSLLIGLLQHINTPHAAVLGPGLASLAQSDTSACFAWVQDVAGAHGTLTTLPAHGVARLVQALMQAGDTAPLDSLLVLLVGSPEWSEGSNSAPDPSPAVLPVDCLDRLLDATCYYAVQCGHQEWLFGHLSYWLMRGYTLAAPEVEEVTAHDVGIPLSDTDLFQLVVCSAAASSKPRAVAAITYGVLLAQRPAAAAYTSLAVDAALQNDQLAVATEVLQHVLKTQRAPLLRAPAAASMYQAALAAQDGKTHDFLLENLVQLVPGQELPLVLDQMLHDALQQEDMHSVMSVFKRACAWQGTLRGYASGSSPLLQTSTCVRLLDRLAQDANGKSNSRKQVRLVQVYEQCLAVCTSVLASSLSTATASAVCDAYLKQGGVAPAMAVALASGDASLARSIVGALQPGSGAPKQPASSAGVYLGLLQLVNQPGGAGDLCQLYVQRLLGRGVPFATQMLNSMGEDNFLKLELSLLQTGGFSEAYQLLLLVLPGDASSVRGATGCWWDLSVESMAVMVSSTVDGLVKGTAPDNSAIDAALALVQRLVQQQPTHRPALLRSAGGAILHGYTQGAVLQALDAVSWQAADAETPDGFEACLDFINRTLGTRSVRLAANPELGKRIAHIGAVLTRSSLISDHAACMRLSEAAHRALMALMCGQGRSDDALQAMQLWKQHRKTKLSPQLAAALKLAEAAGGQSARASTPSLSRQLGSWMGRSG